MMSWAISGLARFEFINAKQKDAHHRIYEYGFNPSKLPTHERKELSPPLPKGKAPSLEVYVMEKVKQEGAIWRGRLARLYCGEFGGDEEETRTAFKNVLENLRKSGDLDRMPFKMGDNVAYLYYRPAESSGMSGLHEWLTYHTAQQEKEKGRKILHIARQGEGKPDIETDTEFIECETGKKKGTDDLQKRIATFAGKPFRIIVPNEDTGKEYDFLNSERVKVEVMK